MLVRYFAAACEAAGLESEVIDARGLDVQALVAQLSDANPDLGKILRVSALLADGVRADGATQLAGVSQLDVLPPFAGG